MGRGYTSLPIEDFSGGWNPRDAWSQVADNESPECLNVTLDERGGVTKRLGLTKSGSQIVNTANIQNLFYSEATDLLIAQVADKLYKSTDAGASWSASIKTFTTSERCGMCDFLGKIVFVHPTDTCFSYDGTTFSGAIANSPKGKAITSWQNYLWSTGDPTAGQTSRVQRSDAGAITWPASPVFTDLRYKDDQACTAIGGGVGMDEVGRGGLLVFKEGSTYRIHDTATLANTIVDYNYGASGPLAVVTNRGLTCAISRSGIIGLRGDSGKAELVSEKLAPLFSPNQSAYQYMTNMAAGRIRDRMVFSLPWKTASTVNTMTLEFHPTDGWFVPHDFGSPAFATYTKNTQVLYGGKIGTGSSSYGYAFKVFNGSTDDGTNIAGRWQSRWFSPFAASEVRFRRCIVNGRGAFTLYVKRNYDTGLGDAFPITITGTGSPWGTAVWGTDTWGTNLSQDTEEIFSLGHGRSISFEIQDSSSLTATTPPFLDTGGTETIGSFSLYGLTLDMVPLGAS